MNPICDAIIKDSKAGMRKCVTYLEEELKGLRTGRASAGLVESIRVEYYGSMTPLKELANISTPDARTIAIKPFDATQLKPIEKAILAANIGMTPANDGKIVRLNVPPLNQETRGKLVSKVKELAEAQRVAIRNTRRDQKKAIEAGKKDGKLTEDEQKRMEKELDEVTKGNEKDIDKLLEVKSQEIMAL